MIEKAREELILAIDLAEQKNDDNPLYLWSRHNVALTFFGMGDLKQAKTYSLQAIEKCLKHTDSFYLLALIAAEEGKWKDVLSFGNNYIKLVNFFEEHPDKAGLIVNATMKEGASIHLVMGHAFHAQKDFDRMTECYEKAYEISESDKKWQVWFNAGCFHMDRAQNLDRARNYLNLALEESPEEQEIWYMLAKLNKKTKLFQDEKQCLEKLFILGAEDIVILNRLASLCIEAGDFDGAFEALDKAKKSGTLNYPAMCNLGLIYRKQEQMEKAIQAYMQAVELHPQGVEAWTILGEISLDVDRLDEAGVFFERALSLQSGLMKVLLQLCEIELRQNRMIEFLRRCDLVLKELGLDRDKTINDMEDVVAILLEIDFAARNSPEIAAQALRVLRLLPVDFGSFSHTKIEALLKDKDAEETEFFLKELQKLSEANLCQPSKKS
jgi:tetratricopeptide (TPR) repeat protein